jgi:hypothetical protein
MMRRLERQLHACRVFDLRATGKTVLEQDGGFVGNSVRRENELAGKATTPMATTQTHDSETKTQGGTHEQHVAAGRKGGEAHHQAASHHEAAAHHHRQAAYHAEEGNHDQAHNHSSRAHEHSTQAHEASTHAHKTGGQGGTHEQHVAAGHQSHKNS